MVRKGILVAALVVVVGWAVGCTEGRSGQSQQPDPSKQGKTIETTTKTTPRTTPRTTPQTKPKQEREKKEKSPAPSEAGVQPDQTTQEEPKQRVNIWKRGLCALEKYAGTEHGGDLSAANEKLYAEQEGPESGPTPSVLTRASPARLEKEMADRGYTCTDSEALERAEQRRQEHKDRPSTKTQADTNLIPEHGQGPDYKEHDRYPCDFFGTVALCVTVETRVTAKDDLAAIAKDVRRRDTSNEVDRVYFYESKRVPARGIQDEKLLVGAAQAYKDNDIVRKVFPDATEEQLARSESNENISVQTEDELEAEDTTGWQFPYSPR